MIVHAGCVARLVRGRWAGVLLTGPSGAGKSDLALRLMERGWRLVADDRALLWTSCGQLYAKSPATLSGLIEARGVDVCARPRRELAPVRLVVACEFAGAAIERIPERAAETLEGVRVERVALPALEASAPEKVELALLQAVSEP